MSRRERRAARNHAVSQRRPDRNQRAAERVLSDAPLRQVELLLDEEDAEEICAEVLRKLGGDHLASLSQIHDNAIAAGRDPRAALIEHAMYATIASMRAFEENNTSVAVCAVADAYASLAFAVSGMQRPGVASVTAPSADVVGTGTEGRR